MAIVLELAKRREGVSWRQGVDGGGSNNTSARIGELEDLGHRFHRNWEISPSGSRYRRYWWLGWKAPSLEAEALNSTRRPSQTQSGTYSANL